MDVNKRDREEKLGRNRVGVCFSSPQGVVPPISPVRDGKRIEGVTCGLLKHTPTRSRFSYRYGDCTTYG